MSSIAGTSFKSATDLASLSTPDEIRQTHYSLLLTVDFGTKTLVGSTTISFVILKENANTIVLDTNGLDIHRVIIDDAPVGWTLGDSVDPFGRPLSITLPSPGKLNSEVKVKIDYSTTEKSGALQWLPPAQTDGKVYPFLFSQCQAIHARSMMQYHTMRCKVHI